MNDTLTKNPIFEVYMTSNRPKGIISIPHSGLIIPDLIKPFLLDDAKALNCDVDFEVHKLIDIESLNKAGVSIIKSNIHRTAIDLNRDRPVALLNWKSNSKGTKIVLKEPDATLKEEFLGTYYDPYYEMIKVMIHELQEKAPHPVSFVDLHSMPSEATAYHLKINPNQDKTRPDFCVSDQHGKTCDAKFIQKIVDTLNQNYQATINKPYIGGHVTIHVNEHFQNINNIQVEINRKLYMNEKTISLVEEKAQSLKNHLTSALIDLFENFSQS